TVPDLIECLADESKPWLQDVRICDMAVEALQAIGTRNALQAISDWRIANGIPEPDVLPHEPVTAEPASGLPGFLDDLLQVFKGDEDEAKADASEEGTLDE